MVTFETRSDGTGSKQSLLLNAYQIMNGLFHNQSATEIHRLVFQTAILLEGWFTKSTN